MEVVRGSARSIMGGTSRGMGTVAAAVSVTVSAPAPQGPRGGEGEGRPSSAAANEAHAWTSSQQRVGMGTTCRPLPPAQPSLSRTSRYCV